MNGLFSIDKFNLLPFSCGLIVIAVGYIKLWKLRKTTKPESVSIFTIWLIGIIGLLFGFFGQVMSQIQAFDTIQQAGDISPALVAEGIKQSYKSLLIGLAVLIISLIIWAILKEMKQRRINLKTLDIKY